MNLLDRIKLGLMVLIPIFFACQTDDDGGLQVNIDNVTDISFAEFELRTTNLFVDSMRTDNDSAALAGKYNDLLFGEILAKSYLGFRYDSGSVIADTAIFDSLVFTFELLDYSTNSVNNIVTLTVHELTETIYETAVYLANKELNESENSYDTISLKLNRIDKIYYHSFNRRFGRILFAKLKGLDLNELRSTNGFFSLVSADDNESLLAINLASSETHLDLYTSDSRDSTYLTKLTLNTAHFTNVQRDRLSSTIPEVNNLDTFNISPANSYISPVNGIGTLIDLSPLLEFVRKNEKIIINRADLDMILVSEADESISQIRHYFYNENNGYRGDGIYSDPFYTAILNSSAYIRNIGLGGYSVVSDISIENNIYSSEITNFVEFFHLDYYENSSFFTTKLLAVGNRQMDLKKSSLSSNGVKLKIYYTSIK